MIWLAQSARPIGLAACLLMLPILSSVAGQGTDDIRLTPTDTDLTERDRRQPNPRILLGIDVLERSGFKRLQGKRIGLLSHPAGVNRHGVSTIQILYRSPHVDLVALFGPEHGIYGNEKANAPIGYRRDPRTGLPIYSLYGKYRKPTPVMLRGIDTMVIDLQDLGVRSYTYVSAMRKTMEACFQHRVEVIVLDRPNPLGGRKVDGPPLESRWMSYVGAFRTPYVHGLTIGELARMAHSLNGWLEVPESIRKRGQLTVIPMEGWRRNMLWTDTGLQWVPTSPAIPDLSAALGYSMTGLGAQIGGFRHGYGTPYPFRLLTFPGKSPDAIASALRARRIPGVEFKRIDYRGLDGKYAAGLYVIVSDWNRVRPTEISFYMMQIAATWGRNNPFATARAEEAALYNKHVGCTAWWNAIKTQGASVDVPSFIKRWQDQALVFQSVARKFFLYA